VDVEPEIEMTKNPANMNDAGRNASNATLRVVPGALASGRQMYPEAAFDAPLPGITKRFLIGVPKETALGEKRVATVPDVVAKLVKLGFTVAIESGAGDAANFADDTYRAAGAQVVPTAAELWAQSDIVFKVRPPSPKEVGQVACAARRS
jgi:hypothetical protein